ncbi:hypothetical protein [Streptomyces sp. NPDC095602]|uniref:hypothetical protein n=1 Tax=Streptomyces sp. NPDC095602 TaxID=3155819 RepID=UPI0033176C91
MKISQDIRREHGVDLKQDEIEAGMTEKSKEFAAAGNPVIPRSFPAPRVPVL